MDLNILIVEDNADLARAIQYQLEREGYDTHICLDGEAALDYLWESPCALVILDRMLPKLDGLEVLKTIRREKMGARVLMLTALGSVRARVEGLDAGADDYLGKPFDTEELLARVRALCRRPESLESDSPRCGDLSLDPALRLLTGPSGSCALSKREAQLLEVFARNPGQTLSRALLFSRVWGALAPVEEGNLDSYIHFLRRDLAEVGSACRIRTIHGVGYRMEAKGC